MKKNVFGRQFKRDANERKALFKNLLTSLVMHERIQTTEAKAKAIKSSADKLVTRAKKGPGAERFLAPQVNHDAVLKLMNDIAPRFAARQGGYTRIIRVKNRVADNAPQVVMEWVDRSERLEMRNEKSKKEKHVNKEEKVKADATIEAVKATKDVKPKKEQAAKPGIFKRLVTRQKKG